MFTILILPGTQVDTDTVQQRDKMIDREDKGIQNKGNGQYLFVDGAVVVGGGDVIILRVKKTLLVVQQLCQDSADGLLVS